MKVDLERRIPQVGRLRPRLVALAKEQSTPFYAYDAAEARANLQRFRSAFNAAGAAVRVFFAIKSNPHRGLLETLVAEGAGLDASSERELRLALRAGGSDVVLTGPAKGPRELELAVRQHRRVVVHLEGPEEVAALGQLAASRRRRMRCGIRVATRHQRRWSKFGVPLEDLPACIELARRYPWLELTALHFHSGTLADATPVVRTIGTLGRFMRAFLTIDERRALTLLDVGGGVVPEAYEGLYPWNRAQTMRFGGKQRLLQRILADEIDPHYEAVEVEPLEPIARAVVAAFAQKIAPLAPNIALGAEPGKYLAHSVLHLLFRVAAVKNTQTLIVDGGTNMIGWEKYEYFDYAPIFNLTRYAPRSERPTLVYGSLCTPHDLWGYYLRGKQPRLGDLLCMPFQGAYTYTLAQDFIRPVPPVLAV